MNIFKVLKSGDGSIDEPTVSAFLGYLLNPKADHGLNDSFLKMFLHECFKNFKDFPLLYNNNIQGLSILSNNDVEVFLEQAFKNLVIDKGEIRTDEEQIERVDDENEGISISKNSKGKNEIVDIVITIYEQKGRLKQSRTFDQGN